jgi:aryl-alcohol dehydrogenase-like predicted oxidoreductase
LLVNAWREELAMRQQKDDTLFLGSAELPISRVGMGTWAIGGGWGPQPEPVSLQALHCALELGCGLIDTAALYGNGRAERLIAQAFKEHGQRVTTVTKIYPMNYHWSPAPGTPIEQIYPQEHIIAQAEASLRRLETDCLDVLLFQTWCPTWSEETTWYETMLKLREQGKIRTFGISVSDHRPGDANAIIAAGRVDIVEAAYSILDQRIEKDLLPLAQQRHISVIARTPLASGALAGHWHEGMKFHRADWRRRVFRGDLLERTVRRIAQVKALVEPITIPLAQIALCYCLSHPVITAVIPGARSSEQVSCNLAAAEQGSLSQELLDKIAHLWHEDFQHNVRTSIGEDGEG